MGEFINFLVIGGFVAFLLFISTNYQKIKVKKMLENEDKKNDNKVK